MDHTANSITVLGTGPSKPTIFERPTSSGRRSTTPKLLQRSGSTLEILPNEAEVVGLRTGPNKTNNHHTKSDTVKDTPPSSQSKREDTNNSNKVSDNKVSSSSSHKKVVLPSVKRDFEKYGMPNNEELESFVRSTTPTLNKTSITDNKSTLNSLETKHGMPDNEEFESFVCSTTPTLTVAEDKSTLNSLETGVHGIKLESAKQAVTVTDDYYVSHRSNSSTEHVDPQIDGTGRTTLNLNENDKIDVKTNSIKQMKSVSNGYYVSHSKNEVDSQDFKPKTIVTQKASNEDADSDDSGDEVDEEEKKAPIELLGEFLETVMEKDYENAQKLCQMILIYEPENKEAIEFKPLIDEELRKERERQLWGSSSEEESSDEDSDDDDDDETEDESDTDSDEEDDDDEDDESNTELNKN
ncbi:uncharacterized protein [Antedon mediterranea]|uniref:uncharacterized protein n=1 Tax=Antedon mediterranea TaxID=105859 RepID=UPI003AF47DB3